MPGNLHVRFGVGVEVELLGLHHLAPVLPAAFLVGFGVQCNRLRRDFVHVPSPAQLRVSALDSRDMGKPVAHREGGRSDVDNLTSFDDFSVC